MPQKLSEQAFWREFLIKNNKFQTIAFGGNNPLFVPFTTIEKDYDEIYINNNKPQVENSKDNLKISEDVNFVQNLTTNFEFHGSFNKKYESDALQGLVRDCETDKDLLKKKKDERDLNEKAEKVITKYNMNSNRIINSMKN